MNLLSVILAAIIACLAYLLKRKKTLPVEEKPTEEEIKQVETKYDAEIKATVEEVKASFDSLSTDELVATLKKIDDSIQKD